MVTTFGVFLSGLLLMQLAGTPDKTGTPIPEAPVKFTRLIAAPADQTSSLPLDEVVKQFNESNASHPIGKDQPPLTVDEVVTSIRWVLNENAKPVQLTQDELQHFCDIAEKKLVAYGWHLGTATHVRGDEGRRVREWSIRLTLLPRNSNEVRFTHVVYRRLLSEEVTQSADSTPSGDRVDATIRNATLPDETIDPKLVAWGQPDADGLSLGIYLSPRKDVYQMGDRLRLGLFVRNDGKQTVETSWANTTHPMPDDFTITDETGVNVAVRIGHDSWRHAWILGYMPGEIALGEIHAFRVPYEISVGDDRSIDADKLIGRVIAVRSGQALKLKVRASSGNLRARTDKDSEPESGTLTFQVAEQPVTHRDAD